MIASCWAKTPAISLEGVAAALALTAAESLSTKGIDTASAADAAATGTTFSAEAGAGAGAGLTCCRLGAAC